MNDNEPSSKVEQCSFECSRNRTTMASAQPHFNLLTPVVSDSPLVDASEMQQPYQNRSPVTARVNQKNELFLLKDKCPINSNVCKIESNSLDLIWSSMPSIVCGTNPTPNNNGLNSFSNIPINSTLKLPSELFQQSNSNNFSDNSTTTTQPKNVLSQTKFFYSECSMSSQCDPSTNTLTLGSEIQCHEPNEKKYHVNSTVCWSRTTAALCCGSVCSIHCNLPYRELFKTSSLPDKVHSEHHHFDLDSTPSPPNVDSRGFPVSKNSFSDHIIPTPQMNDHFSSLHCQYDAQKRWIEKRAITESQDKLPSQRFPAYNDDNCQSQFFNINKKYHGLDIQHSKMNNYYEYPGDERRQIFVNNNLTRQIDILCNLNRSQSSSMSHFGNATSTVSAVSPFHSLYTENRPSLVSSTEINPTKLNFKYNDFEHPNNMYICSTKLAKTEVSNTLYHNADDSRLIEHPNDVYESAKATGIGLKLVSELDAGKFGSTRLPVCIKSTSNECSYCCKTKSAVSITSTTRNRNQTNTIVCSRSVPVLTALYENASGMSQCLKSNSHFVNSSIGFPVSTNELTEHSLDLSNKSWHSGLNGAHTANHLLLHEKVNTIPVEQYTLDEHLRNEQYCSSYKSSYPSIPMKTFNFQNLNCSMDDCDSVSAESVNTNHCQYYFNANHHRIAGQTVTSAQPKSNLLNNEDNHIIPHVQCIPYESEQSGIPLATTHGQSVHTSAYLSPPGNHFANCDYSNAAHITAISNIVVNDNQRSYDENEFISSTGIFSLNQMNDSYNNPSCQTDFVQNQCSTDCRQSVHSPSSLPRLCTPTENIHENNTYCCFYCDVNDRRGNPLLMQNQINQSLTFVKQNNQVSSGVWDFYTPPDWHNYIPSSDVHSTSAEHYTLPSDLAQHRQHYLNPCCSYQQPVEFDDNAHLSDNRRSTAASLAAVSTVVEPEKTVYDADESTCLFSRKAIDPGFHAATTLNTAISVNSLIDESISNQFVQHHNCHLFNKDIGVADKLNYSHEPIIDPPVVVASDVDKSAAILVDSSIQSNGNLDYSDAPITHHRCKRSSVPYISQRFYHHRPEQHTPQAPTTVLVEHVQSNVPQTVVAHSPHHVATINASTRAAYLYNRHNSLRPTVVKLSEFSIYDCLNEHVDNKNNIEERNQRDAIELDKIGEDGDPEEKTSEWHAALDGERRLIYGEYRNACYYPTQNTDIRHHINKHCLSLSNCEPFVNRPCKNFDHIPAQDKLGNNLQTNKRFVSADNIGSCYCAYDLSTVTSAQYNASANVDSSFARDNNANVFEKSASTYSHLKSDNAVKQPTSNITDLESSQPEHHNIIKNTDQTPLLANDAADEKTFFVDDQSWFSSDSPSFEPFSSMSDASYRSDDDSDCCRSASLISKTRSKRVKFKSNHCKLHSQLKTPSRYPASNGHHSSAIKSSTHFATFNNNWSKALVNYANRTSAKSPSFAMKRRISNGRLSIAGNRCYRKNRSAMRNYSQQSPNAQHNLHRGVQKVGRRLKCQNINEFAYTNLSFQNFRNRQHVLRRPRRITCRSNGRRYRTPLMSGTIYYCQPNGIPLPCSYIDNSPVTVVRSCLSDMENGSAKSLQLTMPAMYNWNGNWQMNNPANNYHRRQPNAVRANGFDTTSAAAVVCNDTIPDSSKQLINYHFNDVYMYPNQQTSHSIDSDLNSSNALVPIYPQDHWKYRLQQRRRFEIDDNVRPMSSSSQMLSSEADSSFQENDAYSGFNLRRGRYKDQLLLDQVQHDCTLPRHRLLEQTNTPTKRSSNKKQNLAVRKSNVVDKQRLTAGWRLAVRNKCTIRSGKRAPTSRSNICRFIHFHPGFDKVAADTDEEVNESEPVIKSPSGRFIRLEEIGRGSFKTVHKGLDSFNGVAVAWCELQDIYNRAERTRFREEVKLLKQLQHPNIVRFFDHWVYATNKNRRIIVLVTELMTSGSLKAYLRNFKSELDDKKLKIIKSWCRQILQGLAYMHSRNPPVIHRDLKCDNIFISGTTGSVKIGDLGLAVFKTETFAKSMRGTVEFMAPEMFEELYDEMVDIYSFGLCLLELVTGDYPYIECRFPTAVMKKVMNGCRPDCYYKLKNENIRDIVECCIRRDKNQRLSAKELLDHSFFMENRGLQMERIKTTCTHEARLSSLRSHLAYCSISSDGKFEFKSTPSPTQADTTTVHSLHINTLLNDCVDNDLCRVVEFKLKIIDPSKRSRSLLGESDAIAFKFDMKADSSSKMCSELLENQIISEEDVQFINQILYDKLATLRFEKYDRLILGLRTTNTCNSLTQSSSPSVNASANKPRDEYHKAVKITSFVQTDIRPYWPAVLSDCRNGGSLPDTSANECHSLSTTALNTVNNMDGCYQPTTDLEISELSRMPVRVQSNIFSDYVSRKQISNVSSNNLKSIEQKPAAIQLRAGGGTASIVQQRCFSNSSPTSGIDDVSGSQFSLLNSKAQHAENVHMSDPCTYSNNPSTLLSDFYYNACRHGRRNNKHYNSKHRLESKAASMLSTTFNIQEAAIIAANISSDRFTVIPQRPPGQDEYYCTSGERWEDRTYPLRSIRLSQIKTVQITVVSISKNQVKCIFEIPGAFIEFVFDRSRFNPEIVGSVLCSMIVKRSTKEEIEQYKIPLTVSCIKCLTSIVKTINESVLQNDESGVFSIPNGNVFKCDVNMNNRNTNLPNHVDNNRITTTNNNSMILAESRNSRFKPTVVFGRINVSKSFRNDEFATDEFESDWCSSQSKLLGMDKVDKSLPIDVVCSSGTLSRRSPIHAQQSKTLDPPVSRECIAKPTSSGQSQTSTVPTHRLNSEAGNLTLNKDVESNLSNEFAVSNAGSKAKSGEIMQSAQYVMPNSISNQPDNSNLVCVQRTQDDLRNSVSTGSDLTRHTLNCTNESIIQACRDTLNYISVHISRSLSENAYHNFEHSSNASTIVSNNLDRCSRGEQSSYDQMVDPLSNCIAGKSFHTDLTENTGTTTIDTTIMPPDSDMVSNDFMTPVDQPEKLVKISKGTAFKADLEILDQSLKQALCRGSKAHDCVVKVVTTDTAVHPSTLSATSNDLPNDSTKQEQNIIDSIVPVSKGKICASNARPTLDRATEVDSPIASGQKGPLATAQCSSCVCLSITGQEGGAQSFSVNRINKPDDSSFVYACTEPVCSQTAPVNQKCNATADKKAFSRFTVIALPERDEHFECIVPNTTSTEDQLNRHLDLVTKPNVVPLSNQCSLVDDFVDNERVSVVSDVTSDITSKLTNPRVLTPLSDRCGCVSSVSTKTDTEMQRSNINLSELSINSNEHKQHSSHKCSLINSQTFTPPLHGHKLSCSTATDNEDEYDNKVCNLCDPSYNYTSSMDIKKSTTSQTNICSSKLISQSYTNTLLALKHLQMSRPALIDSPKLIDSHDKMKVKTNSQLSLNANVNYRRQYPTTVQSWFAHPSVDRRLTNKEDSNEEPQKGRSLIINECLTNQNQISNARSQTKPITATANHLCELGNHCQQNVQAQSKLSRAFDTVQHINLDDVIHPENNKHHYNAKTEIERNLLLHHDNYAIPSKEEIVHNQSIFHCSDHLQNGSDILHSINNFKTSAYEERSNNDVTFTNPTVASPQSYPLIRDYLTGRVHRRCCPYLRNASKLRMYTSPILKCPICFSPNFLTDSDSPQLSSTVKTDKCTSTMQSTQTNTELPNPSSVLPRHGKVETCYMPSSRNELCCNCMNAEYDTICFDTKANQYKHLFTTPFVSSPMHQCYRTGDSCTHQFPIQKSMMNQFSQRRVESELGDILSRQSYELHSLLANHFEQVKNLLESYSGESLMSNSPVQRDVPPRTSTIDLLTDVHRFENSHNNAKLNPRHDNGHSNVFTTFPSTLSHRCDLSQPINVCGKPLKEYANKVNNFQPLNQIRFKSHPLSSCIVAQQPFKIPTYPAEQQKSMTLHHGLDTNGFSMCSKQSCHIPSFQFIKNSKSCSQFERDGCTHERHCFDNDRKCCLACENSSNTRQRNELPNQFDLAGTRQMLAFTSFDKRRHIDSCAQCQSNNSELRRCQSIKHLRRTQDAIEQCKCSQCNSINEHYLMQYSVNDCSDPIHSMPTQLDHSSDNCKYITISSEQRMKPICQHRFSRSFERDCSNNHSNLKNPNYDDDLNHYEHS